MINIIHIAIGIAALGDCKSLLKLIRINACIARLV